MNKEDTITLYGYEFDDKNEIIITRNETEVTMLNFQDETELPDNPNYEPKQRFTSNDFVAPRILGQTVVFLVVTNIAEVTVVWWR